MIRRLGGGTRKYRKRWDGEKTEGSRQEYKEMPHKMRREEAKAKKVAYDELYERLDANKGEKDLYYRG